MGRVALGSCGGRGCLGLVRLCNGWLNRLPLEERVGSGIAQWVEFQLQSASLFRQKCGADHMKTDTHPKYNEVVFQDVSSNLIILTRSTMTSKDTIKWEDGKEYPLIKVEISSASHPFYTGKHKVIDAGGRVDKFRKRYGATK
jgi:large subunit ribosomal protein L31